MNDKKALKLILQNELKTKGPSDTLIYLEETYNTDFADNKTIKAFLQEIREKYNKTKILNDLAEFLSQYSHSEMEEIKKAFKYKYED